MLSLLERLLNQIWCGLWKYFLSHLVWLLPAPGQRLEAADVSTKIIQLHLVSTILNSQTPPAQPWWCIPNPSLNTLEMWCRSRTKFRDLNPWFMMPKLREQGGQVRRERRDTYGFTMEREYWDIDQTSSPPARSETELGRKSQEQFVTVASPVLLLHCQMQNWQPWLLAGWVRRTNEPPGPHIYH